MRRGFVFLVAGTLVLIASQAFAQLDETFGFNNDAFWVSYWASPRVAVFGPEQESFNGSVQEVMFPWDDHDEPSNPNALDDNVRYLQQHPNVRFYIEGYASTRGLWDYNLALSQRRANWVKQSLISKGIAENRILDATGWGEHYPVCTERNDECWKRNRLVRLVYAPS